MKITVKYIYEYERIYNGGSVPVYRTAVYTDCLWEIEQGGILIVKNGKNKAFYSAATAPIVIAE